MELIRQFAAWFPERKIVVSGDSAYGGKSVLQHLPENVDLISRVASNAALYEPAPPPRPKQKGAPRKKGDRLPAMAEWAADEAKPWEELEFDQYGLHATLQVKTIRGAVLQGGQGSTAGDRLGPRHRGGPARPDVLLHATGLGRADDPVPLRGALECGGHAPKRQADDGPGGSGEPDAEGGRADGAGGAGAVRPDADLVRPGGHRSLSFPDRPWYPGKEEPSYADILGALRRESWRGQFAGVDWEREGQETPLAQLIEFVSRAA